MPIIKSAIKKLRQDKKRQSTNKRYETLYKKALKDVKKGVSKNIKDAYSALDKAAKKGVIHKKKAARLKSMAARLVKSKSTSK